MKDRQLIWTKDQLSTANGTVIAVMRERVLEIGDKRLAIEPSQGSMMRYQLRATGVGKTTFSMRNIGLSVHRLQLDCGGRKYSMNRVSTWHKKRKLIDATGTHIATTTAPVGSTMRVSIVTEGINIPIEDLVFATYGAFFIDVPVYRTKH
ncbi:hypothetical protein UL82_03760 [Corynebacterium kutscheri]|uniref:Uncharacterized protein n=1 Tax=Corynebacterium kutscheri TaxID=35755 RepID=A0A0F6TD59_9CORY|nr:hypothetical protein [Corynebacterium kutscheri]AKE40959.1 hypothetical protein UL82_03760 [Corynebacterium kutscheri]VEH09258.1 DNA repair protein [Corynebacterium kutscheri]